MDDEELMRHAPWEPRHHRRMSLVARAAQFAPFAALTGYEGNVEEVARIVSDRIELDDGEKLLLNEKLLKLQSLSEEKRYASFTYYEPDKIKKGGAYVSREGFVKRIDTVEGVVRFKDHTTIAISEIYAIRIGKGLDD